MSMTLRARLLFLLGFAASFSAYSATTYHLQARSRVLAAPTAETVESVPTESPLQSDPSPLAVGMTAEQYSATETATPSPEPTALPQAPKEADDSLVETPAPSSTPSLAPTLASTSTPTPTPVPAPTATPDVWSPPDLEPIFARYAGEYGVDKNVLERLANCESHFNPSAAFKDYVGMFQFSMGTWANYRTQMGMDPNPSLRTSAEEAIRTAAFVISRRGTTPWPSCL